MLLFHYSDSRHGDRVAIQPRASFINDGAPCKPIQLGGPARVSHRIVHLALVRLCSLAAVLCGTIPRGGFRCGPRSECPRCRRRLHTMARTTKTAQICSETACLVFCCFCLEHQTKL